VYQTRGAHNKSAKLFVRTTIILQSARGEGGFESGRKGGRVGWRVREESGEGGFESGRRVETGGMKGEERKKRQGRKCVRV